MPDYLLEIGTEELPAHYLPEALERLQSLISEALNKQQITFENIITLGTPRRLACMISGLASQQININKKVKGPPFESSFDSAGKPLAPALGFAQKQGISVNELAKEEIGGVSYLVANLSYKSKSVAAVLQEIVPQAIMSLSGERLMRWGVISFKFSRPIRWLVSLLDKDELPILLAHVKSGRRTFGNRLLAPAAISIESPSNYLTALGQAKVIVCQHERRALIEKQVMELAATVSGQPRQLYGSLLSEVVNITEWPHAILGQFSDEYLNLPDTMIETIMVHHQRFFPVESNADTGERQLLPYFIAVSNNDHEDAQSVIKKGNERVLRARLSDGKFFYLDDQKVKLYQRKQALAQLTFQEGMGSYLDKTDRLVTVARMLADSINLTAKAKVCLERTMELCKADLVTNLVRELPELQGYVGSWYARAEMEPPDVVQAIASHYAPRTHNDGIPSDLIGCLAAVIDRLDNLAALFALGRQPSGSSDPYGFRRQSQAVVDILLDGLAECPINITALVESLLILMQAVFSKKESFEIEKTTSDLRALLLQRIKIKLQERDFQKDIVESVLAASDGLANLPDTLIRCQVLRDVLKSSKSLDLVRCGVRIANILNPTSPAVVDPQLFKEPAEASLWEVFQDKVVSCWEANGYFKQPILPAEYGELLSLLSTLTQPIDLFFERVMVNDSDTIQRNNRHGLLRVLNNYFRAIADFSKLQPLLP